MNASLGLSDAAVSITVASHGRSFACHPGQSLLMAGLAAGLDLPYECASGTCGSCRAKLVSGDIESRWPEAPGLSPRDRRRGDVVLLCQCLPKGDCTVDARVGVTLGAEPPRRHGASVAGARWVSRSMCELAVLLDAPMVFLPGQFVILELPGLSRRAYSMANLESSDGRLTFIVKAKTGGAVSTRLCGAMEPGERLIVEGPYGRAHFRAAGARPVVGIAGGSGLGPIWSIAQAATLQPDRDVHLYFGVNAPEDQCFTQEFAALGAARPRFTHHRVVAVADCCADGYRPGLVGDAVIADLPDLRAADVYMAGPPGMIDAIMERFVSEARVDCDRVFFDRFY
jgi:NAD(P)H-flavin reductase/ferredoxin